MSIPRYDRVEADSFGIPQLMGRDAIGCDVYVVGRGPSAKAIECALISGFLLGGGEGNDLVIVSTLGCVNVPMRIGGFLSRGLKLTAMGRPIVLWGTRRAYWDLVHLVRNTKQRLAELLTGQEELPSHIQNAPS